MNTWMIESVTPVPVFLKAVAEYLPAAHTISIEIKDACAPARKIYAAHRSTMKYRPLRDTISPRTTLYYCVLSPALAGDLRELLRHQKIQKILWHIKGYSDRELIFSIHDADSGGSACFSSHLGAKIIRAISLAVKSKYTKCQTGYDWEADLRLKNGR